jgi:hypothetical protein
MKLVYPLGILAALALVACSKDSDSPVPGATPGATAAAASASPTPTAHNGRRNTARVANPVTIQPLLPKHGIYASGGGRTSRPWRVIVDLVAKTINSATGDREGMLPHDKLDHESTRPLTDAEQFDLTGLAERAWREPMPVLLAPTGDYDEILVSVDGEDIFFLEGFGPIRPAEAALLVGKLKRIATTAAPGTPAPAGSP